MMARTKKNKNETPETNDGATTPAGGADNGAIGFIENIVDDENSKTFAELQEQNDAQQATENIINPPPVERNEEFDVDKILKEYGADVAPEKKTRRPRKPKDAAPETARVQMIIPGKLFVTVCDNTATSIVGALDSWLSKTPLDMELLKLRPEQVDQLAPLAEEAIKAMKLENDPITVYFSSLAAIYISNYMTLRAMFNKMQKEKR